MKLRSVTVALMACVCGADRILAANADYTVASNETFTCDKTICANDITGAEKVTVELIGGDATLRHKVVKSDSSLVLKVHGGGLTILVK